MYFYELIKKLSKNIIIYVDIDVVIASYGFGKPIDLKARDRYLQI